MAEQLELFPIEESQQENGGSIQLPEATPILDAEWCFQFFNNEPIIFAWSTEEAQGAPLAINIESVEGQGISFTQNGMNFRIFPRPISEETKLEREKEKNASKN
jgi:hypothetical protein